jgi:hypothetical protein
MACGGWLSGEAILNLIENHSDLGQEMLRYGRTRAIRVYIFCTYIHIFRVDLEYALQLGSPNMFRLEEAETGCMGMTQFASVCLQSDHEEYLPISQQYLFKALPIHLRDLLLDVLFLVSVLNNAMTGISSKNGRY